MKLLTTLSVSTGIALISLVLAASAQVEILRNSDVIEMAAAGISTEVLLKKIKTVNTEFDITASGLIALKRAEVPDEVISAMVDRQALVPPNEKADNTPAFSESGSTPNSFAAPAAPARLKKESAVAARTIAFAKSSAHPSRQALEKELMKRQAFKELGLSILRYKDSADLYVEIGYVPLSWLTHRYVYRIYDRRSGTVVAAGETTSWGSLAANLAKHIARDLAALRQ